MASEKLESILSQRFFLLFSPFQIPDLPRLVLSECDISDLDDVSDTQSEAGSNTVCHGRRLVFVGVHARVQHIKDGG